MKREWMDSPKFEVQTSYGTVYCTATDGKHIYGDANSNGKAMEFRGKRYPMTFHFGLYPDSPSFQLWRDSSPVYGDVPPTYKAKIVESVLVAINSYLRAHPEMLKEARRAAINNDLCRVEDEMAELREKMVAAWTKRSALLGEMDTL